MRYGKLSALASIMAAAVTLAAPAHADVDTDFANQLHAYGIYGPRDYNAWLAKITCKRLGNGLDTQCRKIGGIPVPQPAAGHRHRADLAIPRRRHQHILPRPDADADRGRRTKPLKLRRHPCTD